jgi:hypothetical protein
VPGGELAGRQKVRTAHKLPGSSSSASHKHAPAGLIESERHPCSFYVSERARAPPWPPTGAGEALKRPGPQVHAGPQSSRLGPRLPSSSREHVWHMRQRGLQNSYCGSILYAPGCPGRSSFQLFFEARSWFKLPCRCRSPPPFKSHVTSSPPRAPCPWAASSRRRRCPCGCTCAAPAPPASRP